MGNEQSCNKINFEDVQEVIVNNYAIMISTLPLHKQDCLIKGTKKLRDMEILKKFDQIIKVIFL